jgi:hypothetical protein
MIIQVPPTESYDVPEGRYKAICEDVFEYDKLTDKGPKKFLRVVWRLLDSPTENVRYLVGKNYEPSLAKRGQLRSDLITWFGHDIKPGQFDTQTIKGKEATVTVSHIYNEGHDKPYRWVSEVEPPVNEIQGDEI